MPGNRLTGSRASRPFQRCRKRWRRSSLRKHPAGLSRRASAGASRRSGMPTSSPAVTHCPRTRKGYARPCAAFGAPLGPRRPTSSRLLRKRCAPWHRPRPTRLIYRSLKLHSWRARRTPLDIDPSAPLASPVPMASTTLIRSLAIMHRVSARRT
jgi:hypothetical protein